VTNDERSTHVSAKRFDEYIDALAPELGHLNRVQPFRSYCTGLLLPGKRKSVEPMAARIMPTNLRQTHQSMHHFVADSPWSDERLLARVVNLVIPVIQKRMPISAWIIDDTGMPKKGQHSVGVAHQYCGQLGKQANCQVAVSLSVANAHASLPVSYRLYLPKSWSEDPLRRKTAGVPDEIVFQTKPQIALEQIGNAVAAGIPSGVVIADAAYGNDNGFRDGVTALGLQYAVSIQSSTTVWRPGESPLLPHERGEKPHGRPITRLGQTADRKPIAVLDLARELPQSAFADVAWREGTNKTLRSRFATMRVRGANRDNQRSTPHEVEWLLIEWPKDEDAPTKYWLSTLDESVSKSDLINTVMTRWRIERDYQNLKQELGLGHYEGRSWRGFHHHATLCIAAYGFLLIDQGGFSPSAGHWRIEFAQSSLPDNFRPRGAAN
jgi:SRSO17 transposase